MLKYIFFCIFCLNISVGSASVPTASDAKPAELTLEQKIKYLQEYGFYQSSDLNTSQTLIISCDKTSIIWGIKDCNDEYPFKMQLNGSQIDLIYRTLSSSSSSDNYCDFDLELELYSKPREAKPREAEKLPTYLFTFSEMKQIFEDTPSYYQWLVLVDKDLSPSRKIKVRFTKCTRPESSLDLKEGAKPEYFHITFTLKIGDAEYQNMTFDQMKNKYLKHIEPEMEKRARASQAEEIAKVIDKIPYLRKYGFYEGLSYKENLIETSNDNTKLIWGIKNGDGEYPFKMELHPQIIESIYQIRSNESYSFNLDLKFVSDVQAEGDRSIRLQNLTNFIQNHNQDPEIRKVQQHISIQSQSLFTLTELFKLYQHRKESLLDILKQYAKARYKPRVQVTFTKHQNKLEGREDIESERFLVSFSINLPHFIYDSSGRVSEVMNNYTNKTFSEIRTLYQEYLNTLTNPTKLDLEAKIKYLQKCGFYASQDLTDFRTLITSVINNTITWQVGTIEMTLQQGAIDQIYNLINTQTTQSQAEPVKIPLDDAKLSELIRSPDFKNYTMLLGRDPNPVNTLQDIYEANKSNIEVKVVFTKCTRSGLSLASINQANPEYFHVTFEITLGNVSTPDLSFEGMLANFAKYLLSIYGESNKPTTIRLRPEQSPAQRRRRPIPKEEGRIGGRRLNGIILD